MPGGGSIGLCQLENGTLAAVGDGGCRDISAGSLVWGEYAELRKKVGVPKERTRFETKPELGLKMIRRAKDAGLPFEAVLCDSLYGRSSPFRHALREEHLLYVADIPNNQRVYLAQPTVGVPEPKPGQKGRKPE